MRAILEPGGVPLGDRASRAIPAPSTTANYQRQPCVTRRFGHAIEPQRLYLPFSAHPEVLGSTFFCPPVPAPQKPLPFHRSAQFSRRELSGPSPRARLSGIHLEFSMSRIPANAASPFLRGLNDRRTGQNHSGRAGLQHAGGAAATVGLATLSAAGAGAAGAGAGALTGYAGMASAVSTLGLGGVTTGAASAIGATAASGAALTGAAATSAVVAAAGGPIVAAGLVIGGVGVVGYGVYQLGRSIGNWFF